MLFLTVYLIIIYVKNFSKRFINLGLVVNGASWQQILRNLDPVAGIRIYNKLLKVNNEGLKEKKMIEEKESSLV